MKVLGITQARTGSTRLPNKILKKVNGKTLLEIHLQRILKSQEINEIVVATTKEGADDAVEQLVSNLGLSVYRGSVNDVLDRFYQAARSFKPEWVVRLTSDCPLIDPVLIDAVIEMALNENVDYCSNTLFEKYPDGQDIEVFKFSALESAWKLASLKSEREHVTPYIRNNSSIKGKKMFKSFNYDNSENYGHIRMTVDEQRDFDLIEKVILDMGIDKTWQEYVNYIIEKDLLPMNSNITRNEGLIKSLKND